MAFKMAKNSLFAILLRSPWWVSLGIVGAMVQVSNALLPPDIRGFGWMGGFPFLVISGLALKGQWSQPSARQEVAAFERLQALNHTEMAAALVAGFEREGYLVQKSKRAGADLLLTRQGQSIVVSTQRWKMARPGVEVLKELQQAQKQLQADGAVFVHLFPLSDSAQSWVKSQSLTCLTGGALLKAMVLQSG